MNTVDFLLNGFIRQNPECSVAEYNSGDGNTVWRLDKISAFDENDAVEVLKAQSYHLEQSVRIDGNIALTFFNRDAHMLHLYYCPAERCVRLIDDPFTRKSLVRAAEETPAVCPVRLWQYEIDHSLIDCGMCYIFQLRDGSFFIIDSGHWFSMNDDLRIVDFLRGNASDKENIVVRGWFFSHCHSDHVCKFLDVLRFHPEIRIEALYYNFVSPEHPSREKWDPSECEFQSVFQSIIARYPIPVYKLHPLQQFSVGGILFTVLCTHEDVFPGRMEDFNNSSTVLMAQIGENKVCFPGDAGDEESPVLERRFPAFLRCDVLQQAHHAHFGLSENCYRMFGASVLLSPTTQIKYDEEFVRFPANAVAADIARHVFVASNGTVELTFPLRSHQIRLYPDEILEDFNGIERLWNYSYAEEYKKDLLQRYRSRQKTEEFEF